MEIYRKRKHFIREFFMGSYFIKSGVFTSLLCASSLLFATSSESQGGGATLSKEDFRLFCGYQDAAMEPTFETLSE